MPTKLIGTLVLVAVVGIICGFNMGDEFRCSINLIFYKTPQIPVFLTIICSFIAGVIFGVIATYLGKKGEKEKEKEAVDVEKNFAEPIPPESDSPAEKNPPSPPEDETI